MKIIPLSEGSFTIDKTKVFIPFEAEEDEISDRSRGSLLVQVQPFLVVTKQDVILIDTGLGFFKGGKMQIHDSLLANGIDPETVTKVLLSHLHKDHAGGVSYKDSLGAYHLSFPQATYYVQQQEIDYAIETGFPSYMVEELSVLEGNSQVVILNGNGAIDNFIKYEICGGHSPFHQVFWIEEDGEIIFFGGDNAPQLQQMKSRLVAKYDYDGKKSRDLRQVWWQKGQQEDWIFLFYHDVVHPVFPKK